MRDHVSEEAERNAHCGWQHSELLKLELRPAFWPGLLQASGESLEASGVAEEHGSWGWLLGCCHAWESYLLMRSGLERLLARPCMVLHMTHTLLDAPCLRITPHSGVVQISCGSAACTVSQTSGKCFRQVASIHRSVYGCGIAQLWPPSIQSMANAQATIGCSKCAPALDQDLLAVGPCLNRAGTRTQHTHSRSCIKQDHELELSPSELAQH